MSKDKYNIAVPFFGGAGQYTDVLREIFVYIATVNPSEEDLLKWVTDNTQASSIDGIRQRLGFLERIGLINLESDEVRLTEKGITWLTDTDPAFLYEVLSSEVHGFDTILETLGEKPKTDGELGDAIASTHPEFEWTDESGPAKHRGWLQSLGYVERTNGVNQLTERGIEALERLKHADEPQLIEGETYTKAELEDELQTSFGAYIKGINPRIDDDGELDFILVKAKEDGPYSDDLNGDRFTYIGEGVPEKGDQTLTGANKHLREQANHATVPIYFFFQPVESEELRYEGLIDVIDVEYVSDGDRQVYQFTLERLGIENRRELQALQKSVKEEPKAEDPPLTEDDEEFTITQRRVRSSVFQSQVKEAYNFHCAICDVRRESLAGTYEVEAAHIHPKRDNGRDDVQNGLALCKLHHWAFDSGWLAITDDYQLIVADEPDLEGYDEFAPLEGQQITLPDDASKYPHATFLAKHRERHGLESP